MVRWTVPLTNSNVILHCYFFCFMKKFALHVDHFIPNETSQVDKLHGKIKQVLVVVKK